jgi:NitT/TauT family transport system ATP-binding protein
VGHTPQIVIRDLVKRFTLPTGSMVAVDRVSLEVGQGEFVCIVGPSGCGKTTLLRILAGLETHSGGEVLVYPAGEGVPQARMVFQEQSIFPWMTVAANVEFGVRSRGWPAAERRRIVRDHLERVGLGRFALAYPHQLSGGMKQRVSIARAFATDPEILLMDEPFAALDEQTKLLLQEELLRLWEGSRRTVVYITHSIEEAVSLGDRVVVMTARPGRIKTVMAVDFPRPRDLTSLRRQPAFGEHVYSVWTALREEVLRAKEREAEAARDAR